MPSKRLNLCVQRLYGCAIKRRTHIFSPSRFIHIANSECAMKTQPLSCAVILSEETNPNISINNAHYFNEHNINHLNMSEFDYILFIGDDMDKYIEQKRLIQIIRYCAHEYPKKPMGFAGNCGNVLRKINKEIDIVDTKKLEFVNRKYIDGIDYIIDPQNQIINCASTQSDHVQFMCEEMITKMIDNDEYDIYCDSYSDYAKDKILDEHLVTINNDSYFICFSRRINAKYFRKRLCALNETMTDTELEYIADVFFDDNEWFGSRSVMLLNENNIYLMEFVTDTKSCLPDINQNNYFVCDYYEPMGATMNSGTHFNRMNVVNFKLIPELAYFAQAIKPQVLCFNNGFLCKMMQKYQKTIENIIMEKEFYQYNV